MKKWYIDKIVLYDNENQNDYFYTIELDTIDLHYMDDSRLINMTNLQKGELNKKK